jgi:hypothetical protein
MFFFEKKNQKTFENGSAREPRGARRVARSKEMALNF